MSSIVVAGDTSGSITLAAPAVAGTNTLTLPANTGTVITTASTFAGTGPAFSAYSSAGNSLTNNTYTKVTFDTELFDTNNNFASSRFTPTVAGYYQLNTSVAFDGAVTSEVLIVVYKNGSALYNLYDATTSSTYQVSGACLVYANGSTDYFEVYVYQNSSKNAYSNGATKYTWFNGAMVRSA